MISTRSPCVCARGWTPRTLGQTWTPSAGGPGTFPLGDIPFLFFLHHLFPFLSFLFRSFFSSMGLSYLPGVRPLLPRQASFIIPVSRHLDLLMRCGDVHPHPGPPHPCGVCAGNVTWRTWSVRCSVCSHWVHLVC